MARNWSGRRITSMASPSACPCNISPPPNVLRDTPCVRSGPLSFFSSANSLIPLPEHQALRSTGQHNCCALLLACPLFVRRLVGCLHLFESYGVFSTARSRRSLLAAIPRQLGDGRRPGRFAFGSLTPINALFISSENGLVMPPDRAEPEDCYLLHLQKEQSWFSHLRTE